MESGATKTLGWALPSRLPGAKTMFRSLLVVPCLLVATLAARAQTNDGNPFVNPMGGYGSPTPSGIPSYGYSTVYPLGSGGQPVNYSSFGMPTIGNPNNPVTGYGGRGIMGYGIGSGGGPNNPMGGYGLPDTLGLYGGAGSARSRGMLPYLFQPLGSTNVPPARMTAEASRSLSTAHSWNGPVLPSLRYQSARPATAP